MSTTNGQAPRLDDLREQLELARTQLELRQTLTALESTASYMPGQGLPSWWPSLYQRDSWGRMWLPLGGLWTRKGGADRPFVWTDIDLDRARDEARALSRRNAYAVGALESIADYTVRTGYTYQARPSPLCRGDRVAADLAGQVQQVVDEFQGLNSVGEGEDQYTWADRERDYVLGSVVDGEACLRTFDQGDGSTLVRFVMPEQIREPAGHAGDDCWTFGVHTAPGDIERVLGCAVVYDSTRPDQWEYVPACDLSLLRLNCAPSVKRGLSDFYCTSEAFEQVDKLLRAMRITGALQASIAWIEQFPDMAPEDLAAHVAASRNRYPDPVEHPLTGRQINRQLYEPGTIQKVTGGRTYVNAPLASSTSQHLGIAAAGLRALGSRWRMPEYMISGDASNANYASTLVAGAPFVVRVECRQGVYGRRFLAVMWQAVRNAARAGRFVVGGRVCPISEVRRMVDIIATPPQVAIANPARDAQIDGQDIASGVLSIQTRRARRGLDDETEEANIRARPRPRSIAPADPAAIAALQRSCYAGEIPREAALAQARIVLGYTQEEAEALLPVPQPGDLPSPAPAG